MSKTEETSLAQPVLSGPSPSAVASSKFPLQRAAAFGAALGAACLGLLLMTTASLGESVSSLTTLKAGTDMVGSVRFGEDSADPAIFFTRGDGHTWGYHCRPHRAMPCVTLAFQTAFAAAAGGPEVPGVRLQVLEVTPAIHAVTFHFRGAPQPFLTLSFAASPT